MITSNKQPIFCCSYPKSGRSWIRFILANYLNEIHSLNLNINFNNLFTILPNASNDPVRGIPAYKYKESPDVPLIIFDHSLCSSHYAQFPIIFILRNVHDTLVSNFYQDKHRIKCFDGNIHEYIQSENGVKRLAQYLNSWSKELTKMNHVIISYEIMHNKMHNCVSKIVENILNTEVNKIVLQRAIDLSNFEKMKKIEIESGFPNLKINIDASNNNTLRAREGKVGNYHKHLTMTDIEYIDFHCQKLMNDSTLELLSTFCNQ